MDNVSSMPDATPLLYSFRRCPYAIRARLAIAASGHKCTLREVILRNKPPEMIAASPKGTVPVMVFPDGKIIEESLEIMHWALNKNDPEEWLTQLHDRRSDIDLLIAENDGPFKDNLDRYKYPNRYNVSDPVPYRNHGLKFLNKLNSRLVKTPYLSGNVFSFADAAIVPFIRQFANNDRKWFDALDLSGIQLWLRDILESDRFLRVMEKYTVWENGAEEPIFPPS